MNPQKALITDRVAIVTGSAGGIGRAVARCLAAFGAHIVLVDLKERELQEAAQEVRALGRKALAFAADCRQQATVDRVIGETVRQLGRLDIMVNNLGGTIHKDFMAMTDEEWMNAIDLNLVQAMRWSRGAVRAMQAARTKGYPHPRPAAGSPPPLRAGEGAGCIINFTTIEAYRGAPGYTPYAAAKAGLANFTKSLALEVAPLGFRVNEIAPDVTVTPGILEMAPLFDSKEPLPQVPLSRRGYPEDFGGAAIFLASDLSEWITGETIHVGGGTIAAAGWRMTPSGRWGQ